MSVKPLKVGKTFFVQNDTRKRINKPIHEVNHMQQPRDNSVDVNDFIHKVMTQMKNYDSGDLYGERDMGAVEVDIKKTIAVSKADISNVTSEVTKGKVNNKLDKLKALRKRK